MVPPCALTIPIARLIASMIVGADSDEPMTWKWLHSTKSALAASVRATWPQALCLMLNTKCRSPALS